jgi:predicted metal-dependent enzyme (double-stranded beta helix superfamily)
VTASLAYAGDLSVAELADVVRWVAADETQWAHRVRAPGADRWWTRLYDDPALDVWLLTWLPGHFTDLHDHGSSAAAFSVVRGDLEEARFAAPGEMQVDRCSRYVPTIVDAGVVHTVRAVGTELAVSIHAYSPPLTRMTYYAVDDGGITVARSVETTEPEEELVR